MMYKNVLLVGINSRYNHTNLAVRSICEYAKSQLVSSEVFISEFTINQPLLEILRDIEKQKCDLVLFSVYIWNLQITFRIVQELKKIMPNITIGLGGPEVSYNAQKILRGNDSVDFVMAGEGEQTVTEIILRGTYKNVKGVYHRNEEGEIIFAGERELIENLDALPFPYPNIAQEENKIFYYESSRGCPFKCAYCLSSIDKRVRFASLEKVFSDVKIFLDAKVPLVKFVDRTFNLKSERYCAIWKFIIDNWNGVTTFHFEIEAQQLSEDALKLLEQMPEGAVQFEIGVQSVNEKTLSAIGRDTDVKKIADVVNQIPKTIHQHLDLIAGLPYENLEQFSQSFDYTIKLKPDMLQLGFLKILSGTPMEKIAKEQPAYKYLSTAPYEILSSPEMSWSDLSYLKNIEKLLDAYYNSNQFKYTMNYLIEKENSMFAFFADVLKYFEEKNLIDEKHTTNTFFDLFAEYLFSCNRNDRKILFELLKFDYRCLGKISSVPIWFTRKYNKDKHHTALLNHTEIISTRESYAFSEYEEFDFNPINMQEENCAFLFLYPKSGAQKKLQVIKL